MLGLRSGQVLDDPRVGVVHSVCSGDLVGVQRGTYWRKLRELLRRHLSSQLGSDKLHQLLTRKLPEELWPDRVYIMPLRLVLRCFRPERGCGGMRRGQVLDGRCNDLFGLCGRHVPRERRPELLRCVHRRHFLRNFRAVGSFRRVHLGHFRSFRLCCVPQLRVGTVLECIGRSLHELLGGQLPGGYRPERLRLMYRRVVLRG
jgi:hypothetical protein